MDGTLLVTWWNHGLSGAFSGLTRIDGRMNPDTMLIWNLNWPQCFFRVSTYNTWTAYHQSKGHLGSTMFPSILRWEQHVSYAVLTMASISWFFSVSCPRRLASSSVTASNLSRRLLFSFRRLTMTLAIAQGQDLASCLFETQSCFLEFLSPVFFPPGVMWFSTIELKSFTNNPTDFRGFCWKITLTINRKTFAPGDELATCLHSIGWCCLSPASAYDTPERVRQWQTPWENVWPCCLGRGYASEPCKQRNHRLRVDKDYQCIFLLEQGGWHFWLFEQGSHVQGTIDNEQNFT